MDQQQAATQDRDHRESKSAADHIICQKPEKPKDNKVSNVLGSQGHEAYSAVASPPSQQTPQGKFQQLVLTLKLRQKNRMKFVQQVMLCPFKVI